MEKIDSTVTVVMITYQHEKYIAEAIQSVLDQTFENFELIIVNDGSIDRTDEIIRNFQDERITYIYQENQGPSSAMNNGILAAQGKYIALMSGDDVCYPQRLELQYKYLSKYDKKILFSWIDIIDDNSKELNEHYIQKYFNIPERSREEIFFSFFMKGNDFCATTAMVEKKILLECGLFNLASIQMQDFDMWIKIAKLHNIYIVHNKLIKYRVREGLNNLSLAPSNSVRSIFEECQIYKSIFDDVSIDFFKSSFSEILKHLDFQEGYEYELEKAFLYSAKESTFLKAIGAEKLFNLLQSEEILLVAKSKYGFGLPELYNLTKNTDTTSIAKQIDLEKLLEQTQFYLQQSHLEYAQFQSQQLAYLQKTQFQLNTLKTSKFYETEKLQSQLSALETSKSYEIENLQSQLSALETSKSYEIENLQSQLSALKTSKFWKLRQKWFELRQLIGIADDSKELSLQTIVHSVTDRIHIQKDTVLKIKQNEWNRNLPLVSVIIPCFNYGQYISDAIDSVLNQTFQDFEIIVIDGGSTDHSTVTTLQSLNKPKTKIYYRQGRHLVGDNRNFGIKKAEGKYICCLDADDKIEATYLEKALFLLEVYAYDLVSTSVQCFGNLASTWHLPLNPTLEKIVQYNQISTVAVFSKQIWSKANGYYDYGIGKDYIVEDWDLWVRMLAIGARVINIPEPLMLYRIHGKGRSLSNHPESLSLKQQAKIIISFNQKYLTPQAYKHSKSSNQTQYQVINGYSNLSKSIEKTKNTNHTKILFALPFVITGGADTVLLQIAKYLNENVFDVSIITTIKTDPSSGNNTSKYREITQEVYHLYDFLEPNSRWADFIYYYLDSRKIDIIFIVGSSYFYEILPNIKQRFPNLKIVDQLYNTYGHITNNRKYSNLIDMNIVENKTIETCLLSEYLEQSQKVRLIQNGTDIEYFTHDISLVRPHAIPKEKFIITFLGRFSEEKSPELFVKIATYFKHNESVHFIMGGQGALFSKIQQQISRCGLENKVTLVGLVHPKNYLGYSNLLILPSMIDGRPNSVLESLSMGVPVIASSIGGLPEVIKDGYNGFLCESGNTEDFVERVEQILIDRELYLRMKENAREYAVNNLDIKKMHQQYLGIFQSLARSS